MAGLVNRRRAAHLVDLFSSRRFHLETPFWCAELAQISDSTIKGNGNHCLRPLYAKICKLMS